MKRMTQHEISAQVADLTAGLRPNEGIFVRQGWPMGPDAVEKCVITNPDTTRTRQQYGWALVQTGKPEVAKAKSVGELIPQQIAQGQKVFSPKPEAAAKRGRKPKGDAVVGNK